MGDPLQISCQEGPTLFPLFSSNLISVLPCFIFKYVLKSIFSITLAAQLTKKIQTWQFASKFNLGLKYGAETLIHRMGKHQAKCGFSKV